MSVFSVGKDNLKHLENLELVLSIFSMLKNKNKVKNTR